MIEVEVNKDMKLENTKAQMRKGVLELCVLSIIAEAEAYPSDIINKLKESKLIVVEGTLYPLLNRLKNAELLDYSWRESNSGPPRKYYTITEIGKTVLDELMHTWDELNAAVHRSTGKSLVDINEEN
ncbi:MAG: PadR family transcriptional regulator [Saprospiraceae bacterium]|nr:PadR family transcriptional regulator [Saprospiraceae bacterium]HPN69045.1 PadR family transcriptional regulator [Saprospiraceae bacterium]